MTTRPPFDLENLPDPDDERFRWCVFCGADCWPDEPEHLTHCPTVTGIYPVRREDVYIGDEFVGMTCARCGCELKIGEKYAHQDTDDPMVKICVCVGCSLIEPEVVLSEWVEEDD